MNVVLVHGIFDNGTIFKRLVRMLEEAGHRCWAPALKPADGRKGIHDLACKLKSFIDNEISPEESIAIVGFSMGCIVARQYLQVLGGSTRTKALFAISGPHEGTLSAYLYFGQGARDLRPGSSLLEHLRTTEYCLSELALFVYWTSWDITIFPAKNSNWRLVPSRFDARTILHRFMPSDAKVCIDIVHRVKALDGERRSAVSKRMEVENLPEQAAKSA